MICGSRLGELRVGKAASRQPMRACEYADARSARMFSGLANLLSSARSDPNGSFVQRTATSALRYSQCPRLFSSVTWHLGVPVRETACLARSIEKRVLR